MVEIKKSTAKNEKILLRLPDDLRATLKIAATANSNTLTAEIVSRLEQSVLIDRIALAEEAIGKTDMEAAAKSMPYMEKIKSISEEFVRKAKRDVMVIEQATEGKIRTIIEQTVNEAFDRHGFSKK